MLVGHAIEVCGIMDEQTLGTGHGDEPLVRTSAALFGWNVEVYQSINQSIHPVAWGWPWPDSPVSHA